MWTIVWVLLIIIKQISHEFIMNVTPAKAGAQNCLKYLDSRFRGNDTLYEITYTFQDYQLFETFFYECHGISMVPGKVL